MSVRRTQRDPAINQRARRIVTRLCQIGETVAKTHAPVDTNSLRDSIGYEVDAGSDLISGSVGSNAEHAEPVEYGTEPHFVPIDALKPWAARVLGDESKAIFVARAIAKNGTKAQPFLTPAFEAVVNLKDTVAARTT